MLTDIDNESDAVKFTNLKVWTPEKKSWWRRKVYEPKRTILNDVSGSIKAGDFVGILGPSGAGKTTLLVALAGKCTLPSEGDVTVKGADVTRLQGVVEIMPQTEVFMPNLTVMEHLVFMIEMKLGSYEKMENKMILSELLYELKLKAHVNSMTKALSGGERKLLSLASSLISHPEVLFCDEPTTGLDSYNAALVISVLKKITSSGKTVICTVHQPSSDMFKQFNSIMLMAEGRLLFHGSHKLCEVWFESLNFHCPTNYNPAEFYVKTVSNPSQAHQIAEFYEQSLEEQENSFVVTTYADGEAERPRIIRRNWFKQVQLLLWRSSLGLPRTIPTVIFQLLVFTIFSAILVGVCYAGVKGTIQRGVQDMKGFLWLMCSQVSFCLSFTALFMFIGERMLFKREVGLYSTSAYFFAFFVTLIPRCILWPTCFVALSTVLLEIPNYFITSLELILALIISSIASMAYGLGLAAFFTASNVIGEVMPFTNLPLYLVSGAFMTVANLPVWLYPLQHLSHFFYTMDALSNVYWRKIYHIDCDFADTTKCITNGFAVLIQNGYNVRDFILQDTLGLGGVTLFWWLFGYVGLKLEERKGYAY